MMRMIMMRVVVVLMIMMMMVVVLGVVMGLRVGACMVLIAVLAVQHSIHRHGRHDDHCIPSLLACSLSCFPLAASLVMFALLR